MKDNLRLILIFLFLSINYTYSQSDKDSYLPKVKTIDTTIKTLYEVISGEAGKKRNWDLFRFLFAENAKLIPTNRTRDGKVNFRFITPEEYINTSGKWVETNGFFEKEITRKVERFNTLAHVFTTYQAFRKKEDSKPFLRGINSIQLVHDGTRWWIISLFWSPEDKEHPLPSIYLNK